MTDNPILAVAARAQALRDQGADVITLAAGEPQAATSAAVVEAAVTADDTRVSLSTPAR